MTIKEYSDSKTQGNFRTLARIYNSGQSFWKEKYLWLSLLLSFVFILYVYFFKLNAYVLLVFISDKSIEIASILVGFGLAAFLLLPGLIGGTYTKEVSRPLKGHEWFSLFQKTLSVLAVSIFIQLTLLIFSLVISATLTYQSKQSIDTMSEMYSITINYLICFIEFFLLIYSVFQVIKVLMNVFVLSQVFQFFAAKEHHFKGEK